MLWIIWLPRLRVSGVEAAIGYQAMFHNASILKNRRVVFNIKGNDYRLIVAVAYRFGALYIKFVGNHAEYDQVDAETVEQEL